MKKQYDKPRTPKAKPKMTVTFYEKAFSSFLEMIEEFKKLHPEFSEIFNNNDDNEMYADWAASDVLDYYKRNIPVIDQRKNLLMTVSIAANKVSLKTNKFFSVEWSFKYDRNCNISDLVAVITTFTKDNNPEELNAMIDILKDSWNVKIVERSFNKAPVNK